MSDVFLDQIEAMAVPCPDHGSVMKGSRVEVKSGYLSVLRKIMYVGRCTQEGCHKWFEYVPAMEAAIWP